MEVELATPSYFLQVNLIIKLFIINFRILLKVILIYIMKVHFLLGVKQIIYLQNLIGNL